MIHEYEYKVVPLGTTPEIEQADSTGGWRLVTVAVSSGNCFAFFERRKAALN